MLQIFSVERAATLFTRFKILGHIHNYASNRMSPFSQASDYF